MIRYALKRILTGLITIWFIASATFLAMHMVPGDPLADDKAVPAEIRTALLEYYGLDQPLPAQYLRFFNNMLHGDFGLSFTQKNRAVNDIIRAHFPVSALLGCIALLFAAAGSILWGALAARFHRRWQDYAIMTVVVASISVPGFVFAALAQIAVLQINQRFGTQFPLAGWGTLQQILLPALVLGLGTMAYMTRLMRSSMLDVQQAQYIRTARAKGLSPARIFWVHTLRNASLPVLSTLGPAIAAITTGGFVVETVFAIPGLGRYFVQAVQQLDYTVIMGTTVFYGSFLVLMVLVVDLLVGIVDPRIRLQDGS
ncbi:MAG TPA: ABC transporter permease [Pseudomonadales bacterium]|nr:ABC transporter permease [Pseudomonadales bacterium]